MPALLRNQAVEVGSVLAASTGCQEPERDDFRSTRIRGRVSRTKTEVQPDVTDLSIFEKSALHPVCQHPAVISFEPCAAATPLATRGVPCSGSEQDRSLSR
jgi:hypothetical protein